MSLLDTARAVLPAENVIVLAAALAAFVAVLAVWSGLVAGGGTGARAKALRLRRQELLRGAAVAERNSVRRRSAIGLMRRVVARFNLVKDRGAAAVARRLAAAGWRGNDALVAFLFAKLALPFALGGLAVVWLQVLAPFDLPSMARLLIASLAVVAGAFLPDVVVSNAAQKRRDAMRKGLPDTLDLLVICAEAGLGLEAALTRVAREMARSAPVVGDEIGLTAVELGFLPDRRQALANLNARVDLPAVRAVVNTLVQTEKYGTPLAQSLRVLAAEFRDERLMKAEEKAAKLPAVLTLPLIVFIMPALFVVLLGPAVLRAVDGLGGL